MNRLSLELEENKRLPGWYPVSMYDASLSAVIQMSCVASAATSRCRHGRQRPGLTPAAPSSSSPLPPHHPPPLPHHQGDLAPAPPPSPTGTQGSLCQRLARCQPVSRRTPQATCKPLRTLQKTSDSSHLVRLPLQLIVSQLPSDVKKKPEEQKTNKPGI